MTSEKRLASSLSTGAVDYSEDYYDHYPGEDPGSYGWDTPKWRDFFTSVADRIIGMVEPTRTLDVGCAKGLLVQALASRGVDAYGRDISEYAVKNAHEDVRSRLTVASATEEIEGRYDLITCVEVLEHMSLDDAQVAIDRMCAATDRILFSSTPGDFDDPTHVNVKPTAQWAAWFAERGFFRRADIDASFLSPWAILFERMDVPKRTLVEQYERVLAPLALELSEKRQALLELDRQSVLDADQVRTAQAQVASLEAKVEAMRRRQGRMRERIERLQARVSRAELDLAAIQGSRTWRVGRAVVGPLARLKR